MRVIWHSNCKCSLGRGCEGSSPCNYQLLCAAPHDVLLCFDDACGSLLRLFLRGVCGVGSSIPDWRRGEEKMREKIVKRKGNYQHRSRRSNYSTNSDTAKKGKERMKISARLPICREGWRKIKRSRERARPEINPKSLANTSRGGVLVRGGGARRDALCQRDAGTGSSKVPSPPLDYRKKTRTAQDKTMFRAKPRQKAQRGREPEQEIMGHFWSATTNSRKKS